MIVLGDGEHYPLSRLYSKQQPSRGTSIPAVPVMVVMIVMVVSYCPVPKRHTPSLDLPHFNYSENAMPAPSVTNCLRYWDLADHIQLADAIALWCGVEPAELAKLNFETQCMSAKRAALVTALRDGRLEYEDLGLVTNHGKVFKALMTAHVPRWREHEKHRLAGKRSGASR